MSDTPDEIRARAQALRARTAEKKGEETVTGSGGGLALRFATDLVAGVAVGGGMGYALDKWLGTMPIFLLICLFLGMAGSFLTIYRANQRYAAALEAESDGSAGQE